MVSQCLTTGRRRVVSAALISGLALSSCGGSGPRPAPPPPQRGIKGEQPGREAASSWHIGRGACAALAAKVERRVGSEVVHRAAPSPPLSHCQISGASARVNVYLDASFAAHQRYENRMVEISQFGVSDPRKLPHPVAGVGEPAAGNADANWIPADHTLYAVRGNRWITVDVAIPGASERQLRLEAASVARAAFRLATQ
jgi:hypothetical protein